MKHFLLFLLLFVSASAFGQTPIFTAGITYCNGTPSHNPGNTGSRYAIDTATWGLYVRSYGTTWSKAGDWLQFRTGTGTPAAPPSKFESVFAINASDSLYYYDGATWKHLNPASTGGVTGTGTAGQVAYWDGASSLTGGVDLQWTHASHRLDVGKTAASTSIRFRGDSTRYAELSAGYSSFNFQTFSTLPINFNMLGGGVCNFGPVANFNSTVNTTAAVNIAGGTSGGIVITGASTAAKTIQSYNSRPLCFQGFGNTVRIGVNTTTNRAQLDITGGGATSATVTLRANTSVDSTILLARNDRRVGINTTTPDVSLDAGDNTDQIKLPAGTTAQRAAVNNSIRYNSDVEGFEARENGVWFRLTSSQAPSIAAGAASGTGPTVAIGAGSNDLGGTIEITTGTSTTTGTLATITYGDAFDASLSPHVTITPANAKAAEHMLQWHKGTSGNSSFVLTSRVALDASTLYVFTYQVQQ